MAWPTDRRPDDALTGEFVPQVWSARVINHVRSYLVSMNVVNTTWKAELAKGDKVWIPVMTELTAYDVDTTTTAVINNMNTTLGTTAEFITIDHWKEVPVQIDDSTAKQTQVGNYLAIGANNASYALEKAIDAQVHALFSGLGTTQGADGQTFTDDILIAYMQTLDEADVPRENRSLVGDPSMLADIYKIDKFMSFDYSQAPLGQDGKTVAGTGGFAGNIVAYKLPVFITNRLTAATTGNYGCLLHKDAIGLAIQSAPSAEKYRAHAAHSDIVNISAFWGEDELRDTFGVNFYTRKA